jgi:hypothetical protein
MDSVFSLRCHIQNVAATARAQNRVNIPKETPSRWWITSAAIVPKTATIITADQ